MFALLMALACTAGTPTDEVVQAAAAFEYSQGMWAQRVLTVQSGLNEAVALHGAGQREGAQQQLMLVYQGSFEPELEPLIRDKLDARTATELEYRFGLLRDAMGRKSSAPVAEQVAALSEQLSAAGASLDGVQATLR